jgi:hypothetical protein
VDSLMCYDVFMVYCFMVSRRSDGHQDYSRVSAYLVGFPRAQSIAQCSTDI